MAEEDFAAQWGKVTKKFDDRLKKIKAEKINDVTGKVLLANFSEIQATLKDMDTFLRAKKHPAVDKCYKNYERLSKSVVARLKKEAGSVQDKMLKKVLEDFQSEIADFSTDCKAGHARSVAQDSHDKAMSEKKIDWKAELSAGMMVKLAKLTYETAEFGKFRKGFDGFVSEYGLDNSAKKLPVFIWNELLKNLISTGYVDGKIPHASGDPAQYILAEIDGQTGKSVRTELLRQGMEGLQPFIDHAALYMDKVVKTRKKGDKWAFWSGDGAKDAARAEAKDGIVLEGTVGAWFEHVWAFEKLTKGTKSLVLWAALSELYAKKAAEYYADFEFVGFVGPGATRDQSVFNKIEQPSFIEVFQARKTVRSPPIEWYVVDCDQDGSRWKWSRRPSIKVGRKRSAAIDMVKQKYGK